MADRVQNLVEEVLKTAPRWVTAEYVGDTVDVFEPEYGREMAPSEVLEIIVNVDRLLDFLSEQSPFRHLGKQDTATPRQDDAPTVETRRMLHLVLFGLRSAGSKSSSNRASSRNSQRVRRFRCEEYWRRQSLGRYFRSIRRLHRIIGKTKKPGGVVSNHIDGSVFPELGAQQR